jgi:hypothetical protein
MTTTTRLTGRDAIQYARRHGLTLSKYADPTEGARSDLTIAEAEAVAREDGSLIYVDAEPAYEPVRLTARGEGELRDALRAAGLGVHDYVWSAVAAEVEGALTARRDAGETLGAELRIGGVTVEYSPSAEAVE